MPLKQIEQATETDDEGDDEQEQNKFAQDGNTDDVKATPTPNPYDTILEEARDFLQAAAEAQNLGRLKISASYLALSHSRLIGLAKRFDLAAPSSTKNQRPVLDDQLKALLPADVEWDQAMMVHLASAAAQYHAARTKTPASPNLAAFPRANCDVRSVLKGNSLFKSPEKVGAESTVEEKESNTTTTSSTPNDNPDSVS